jgi:hypothetical protein
MGFSNRNFRFSGRGLTPSAVLLAATVLVQPALAQEKQGSDAAAAAGGALGLYSGAVLGNLGGLIPCSQTYAGATCVWATSAAGGVAGLAGGIAMGSGDEDAVTDAARGALYGLAIGAVGGVVLKETVERFGWSDVATTGLVGAAIGASAKGALIGLGVGSAVGLLLYWTLPSFDLPNAVGFAMMGMAVGGISSWVVRGVEAGQEDPPMQPASISINLRF